MKEIRTQSHSYHRRQRTINVVIQIVLLVLGIMWILPLMWIILTSFR
ncbi:MAG: sugar ABC transporter permease, partial [Ruminococcaceae bacterium]|nr:sugar ABC transporter permease [Oscillospiraceae bacterium]